MHRKKNTREFREENICRKFCKVSKVFGCVSRIHFLQC